MSHGVDDLGDEHHRADLAGVPAGLGTLRDDQVDAGRLVTLGVLWPPGQSADQPALLLDPVDQELRWRPERVGDERRRCGRARSRAAARADSALNGALPSCPEIEVPARALSSAGSSGTS